MADYAIISNGLVANVIVADADFISAHFPGAIDIDTVSPRPGIGWAFDGSTWTAPAPPAPSNPVYSQKEFMDLFTQAELKACLNFATNADLTADQKENLTVFFEYFYRTPYIDMTMANTIGGLQMLASYGLLTPTRAAVIYGSRHF